MQILIMAGIFPPDIGGPANYIPKLCSALVQKGHQVSVLCFSDTTDSSLDKGFSFSVHRILRRQNIILRELKTLLLGLKMARQSDVIYANGNDFKAFLIGLFSGKPCVHKIVGDTSWERAQNKKWIQCTVDEYQTLSKSPILLFTDWVRRYPLQKAFQIITPSYYLQGIVKNWEIPENKVRMIYNSFQPLPASLSEPPPAIPRTNSSKLMGTICRLVPWKGVDTLIQVLASFPELSLLIIGDGPLEKDLKNLCKKLNLEDRVFFTGKQPRTSISGYLNQCDFFILNSSYEGLPHVVLEAMSCEKLVLASAVGGTPEVVKDHETGLLFQYNVNHSIEKAISEALSKNHSQIIKNAKNFIEKDFSFERMIQETEAVLLSATNSR